MKKVFLYSMFLLLSCTPAIADSVGVALTDSNTINTVTPKEEQSNEVSSLTLAVNTVNNILTYSSFVIALLTFATIFAGFFEYRRLKEIIERKVAEIDNKAAEIDDFKQKLDHAQLLLKIQDKYINFANGYLYQTTEQIVNQMEDNDMAVEIFKKMNHNYHIANLYSGKKDDRFASLAYLRENGVVADVEHLLQICDSDPEERYRSLASEIIGIIKYRTEHEKNTDN